ncbi:hypothetical protein [Paenibacillus sp. MBLB4367]|uniref:hypothetical protein n=1 Tax=Paenibacillus sp. MBLB4367 TaxID=3384767 RepID=UPI0039083B73
MSVPYDYTDLHHRQDLIDELIHLEAKMTESLGYPVNLIAYSKKSHEGGDVPDSNCRAGMDD